MKSIAQLFFQLPINNEQVKYAQELVNHSLAAHKIPNIWDGKNNRNATEELRFTGTLGEILFADAYQLPRPLRSFGADDGQDFGKDFELLVDGVLKKIDIKTMRRKSDYFRADYVLNLPARQLQKPNSLTDCYFHISLHQNEQENYIASFLGWVEKQEILTGKIGILYPKNSSRTRGNGTKFTFTEDTYEVDFADFRPAPIFPSLQNLAGFTQKFIKK
jgi:hypothetical protein